MSAYAMPALQGKAGGNIRPMRVVKISTVTDNTFLESASNTSANIGIAQQGTRRAPGTADDDGFAAIAGENIMVFGAGSIAPAQYGATVTRGDKVTSDGNGLLLTTTTTADVVVGWAFQSGAVGDIVAIIVGPFVL